VDNGGGGIFHILPIEDHDTFESQFKTPHGLDFSPTADLYGLEFAHVEDRSEFVETFEASVGREGTQVLSVAFDAAASHDKRETLQRRVVESLD
jgi:2-succinyl-5-enolpyruvyl-6-hydroxy-3-cyclohexene-1-carboxylate synthase